METATDREKLLEQIAGYPGLLRRGREILLANAVMIGEIPAPTFEEQHRIQFLRDRFTEESLHQISVDEMDNVSGLLPGTEGHRNLLVSAHVDTVFPASLSHTITMTTEAARGAGIADNSLGVAAVATLPSLLRLLDVRLKSNLVFLGSTRSLGRGDIGGFRFFLDHVKVPINAGICVEGVHLGRLSFAGLGMLRGEIVVTVPEEVHWERFGGTGAIVELHRVIAKILAIPTPQEPRTTIILGAVNAGNAYNTPPVRASLRFEVRSEESGMVASILARLEEIVDEITHGSDAEAELNIIARRKPGGIGFGHPLVKASRDVMEALGIAPQIGPSTGELSGLIGHEIPGLTLGITRGDFVHEPNESIRIEPVFKGIAQLIGVLQMIDEGACDESD